MSPRKVNKEEKRREIAFACSDLLHEKGMKNITVAEVAKTAGIGKGTVYEYFENKDDIVFEIINMHIESHHKIFLENLNEISNFKEKLYYFFNFVLDDSEENIKHFNGYKEFLSIVLGEENQQMLDFNQTCNVFFKTHLHRVINEAIQSKEIVPEAINFVNGIMIFDRGLALSKMSGWTQNPKEECEEFIETLYELIKIK